MRDHGSQVVRHTNDRNSAMRLIKVFTAHHSKKVPVILDLQEEMVDRGKGLDETTAGIELEGELARERDKLRQELLPSSGDMQEALESRDKEAAEMLRQHQQETDEKMKRLDREREELKIDMERLHEEKYARLERSLEVQGKRA